MTEQQQPIYATVSGSFRRGMSAVQEAVYRLTDAGATVLSPADPRVVDQFGDFLFVASDRVRAIKLVQGRHLAAIEASDFVWLVAPEGYIGQSGAMEVGYARATRTPVYCSEVPSDLTLRQYVTTLPTPEDAIRAVTAAGEARSQPGLNANVLLDPLGAAQAAHEDLAAITATLTQQTAAASTPDVEAAARRLEARVVRPLRSR